MSRNYTRKHINCKRLIFEEKNDDKIDEKYFEPKTILDISQRCPHMFINQTIQKPVQNTSHSTHAI